MNWQVREAKPEDAARIVEVARDHDEFLMPYVLNEFVVTNYISQFLVAEDVVHEPSIHYEVGGAVHYLPCPASLNVGDVDAVAAFLLYVKQVPIDVVKDFTLSSKTAFLGQVVCPSKGSFYNILEELKSRYDELWCWMSVNGPSYKSYERYGFKFSDRREFWNAYKCGYSTFVLGKWSKGG